MLKRTLVRDYVGDATHSREIDLGDDYQRVSVRSLGSGTYNLCVEGWALGDAYGLMFVRSAGTFGAIAGALGNERWQGKMAGADANKIKLGTNGSIPDGMNDNTRIYRITAEKWSAVRS